MSVETADIESIIARVIATVNERFDEMFGGHVEQHLLLGQIYKMLQETEKNINTPKEDISDFKMDLYSTLQQYEEQQRKLEHINIFLEQKVLELQTKFEVREDHEIRMEKLEAKLDEIKVQIQHEMYGQRIQESETRLKSTENNDVKWKLLQDKLMECETKYQNLEQMNKVNGEKMLETKTKLESFLDIIDKSNNKILELENYLEKTKTATSMSCADEIDMLKLFIYSPDIDYNEIQYRPLYDNNAVGEYCNWDDNKFIGEINSLEYCSNLIISPRCQYTKDYLQGLRSIDCLEKVNKYTRFCPVLQYVDVNKKINLISLKRIYYKLYYEKPSEEELSIINKYLKKENVKSQLQAMMISMKEFESKYGLIWKETDSKENC